MRPRTELLLAAGACVTVAAPFLVADGVDFPDDALYYGVSSWEWLRVAAREGTSVWFVPGKLGGVSVYGDVTPMGPLYPFAWLGAVLPVLPAMGLAVLVHALATLLAVRWLAQVHGASTTAATLAGAAVVLGPLGSAAFVDCQVDSWPAFVMLPLVLGCLEMSATSTESTQRMRWIAMGAIALAALLLGTHLRVAVASCGVIALWVLLRFRDLPGAAALCGLGLLAGAPGYVPMILEARAAAEGALTAGAAAPIDQALGLQALGGWLAPNVMSIDRDISLGTVLGLTAIAGFAAERRAAAVVVCLILAGTYIPGVRVVFAPLLMLSHPVNLVWPVLALIPASVLAARGLDRLVAMGSEERTQWLRGPAGLVLVALALASLLRAGGIFGDAPSDYGQGLLWASTGQAFIAGGTAAWVLARPRTRNLTPIFVIALADLLAFGVRAHVAVPSEPLVAAADAFGGNEAALADGFLDLGDLADGFDSVLPGGDRAAIEVLDDEPIITDAGPTSSEDEIRVPELDGPAMQQALLARPWPPHLGMGLGVRGLAGRSKLMPARQVVALRPLAEALHDNTGVEFFLPELFGTPEGLGARTMALHGVRFAAWKDIVAYRVEAVAPLCYSVRRTLLVEDAGERVRRLLSSSAPFDARPALTEGPLPRTLAEPLIPPEHLSCPEPGFTDVSTSMPAVVVRRERWHPGWRVTDTAGRRLETFPVNQVHLGVVAPPGSNRIRYRFVPPGLPPSLLSAAAGFAVSALLLLRSRRRS